MAVKKAFQVLSDLLVYNSIEPTIEVIPSDGYDGAHRYRMRLCTGFNKEAQAPEYIDKTTTIQFVQKNEDGTIIPGLQTEQLLLAALDRHAKLDAKYPSPYFEEFKQGIEMALSAQKKRVEERINRGVMGDLKQ